MKKGKSYTVKKPRYILDSFALLAHFQGEPRGEQVKEILKSALVGEVSVHMTTINIGEVFYIVDRKMDEEKAQEILSDVLQLPINLAEATMERVIAAAKIKAIHAISYADAFVVSLAQELDAAVMTGDPEFKKVDALVKTLWL